MLSQDHQSWQTIQRGAVDSSGRIMNYRIEVYFLYTNLFRLKNHKLATNIGKCLELKDNYT